MQFPGPSGTETQGLWLFVVLVGVPNSLIHLSGDGWVVRFKFLSQESHRTLDHNYHTNIYIYSNHMKFPILFVQTGFIVAISYEVELNRINAVWAKPTQITIHNFQSVHQLCKDSCWDVSGKLDSSLMTNKPSFACFLQIHQRVLCLCILNKSFLSWWHSLFGRLFKRLSEAIPSFQSMEGAEFLQRKHTWLKNITQCWEHTPSIFDENAAFRKHTFSF